MELQARLLRKRRFGLKTSRPTDFDLVLNAGNLSVAEMADLVETAVRRHGLLDAGLLSEEAAAEIQFRVRMQLARLGISTAVGVGQEKPELGHPFGHPSEQVFANLLDFYGIAWAYEPRSFPLQWDKDGRVSEAFTPDFYLPEFDLYVELTTMKQALVTRKNRKIRLLRGHIPPREHSGVLSKGRSGPGDEVRIAGASGPMNDAGNRADPLQRGRDRGAHPERGGGNFAPTMPARS